MDVDLQKEEEFNSIIIIQILQWQDILVQKRK